MHRGTILATLLIALLVCTAGVFAMLDPLLPRTATITLRNPATGRTVTCAANLAPGFGHTLSADAAAETCAEACEEQGFERTGSTAIMVIDYTSTAARERARGRYARFVPAACRITLPPVKT